MSGALTDRLFKGVERLDDGLVDALALLMPVSSYRAAAASARSASGPAGLGG